MKETEQWLAKHTWMQYADVDLLRGLHHPLLDQVDRMICQSPPYKRFHFA
jgi:hypothetical protein